MAIDANGNLFIADTGNSVVLEVTPNGSPLSDGTKFTVAGNGSAGYAGDGGLAIAAALRLPTGLTLDAHGDLFIADAGNNVVREVTPGADGPLSDGTITPRQQRALLQPVTFPGHDR